MFGLGSHDCLIEKPNGIGGKRIKFTFKNSVAARRGNISITIPAPEALRGEDNNS
jgi:hypothetical protein